MSYLPVIVGMGGINAAGRTSSDQAFCRSILSDLTTSQRDYTLQGLIALMALTEADFSKQSFTEILHSQGKSTLIDRYRQKALDQTLIRALQPPINGQMDSMITDWHPLTLDMQTPLIFEMSCRDLPPLLPAQWHCVPVDAQKVRITVSPSDFKASLPFQQPFLVNSVAQLPQGFDPATLYHSVHHPRALSMAIFAASDCLQQSGLVWENITSQLAPDQIAVFASNSTGQLDQPGWGGLLKIFTTGQRATSKQMALGYGQMPADFINAYVLGNAGITAGLQGACATFLYNLRAAVNEIRSGHCKIAMVGTSDAPILPEIIEGFRVMGALADDQSLRRLNQREQLTAEDLRLSCRPFANNCGFTLGESAQFLLLMADDLALATGAQILAAVPDVFVNADGWKRSISSPGLGNYITLAKSVALACEILGEKLVQQKSYIHAHGTSTPKNRVTESLLMQRIAQTFAIENWPVAAIKAFVGHTQGSAAGDQIASALGTFHHQIIPGIPTLDAIAEDVYKQNLQFSKANQPFQAEVAFINAKGFGGNNASTLLLSPDKTKQFLKQRYSRYQLQQWQQKHQQTLENQQSYLQKAQLGEFNVRYLLQGNINDGSNISFNTKTMQVPGFLKPVSLEIDNPYGTLL